MKDMERTIELDLRAKFINATTKVVGVIGYPISHSLSPQMHNAAFAHLGLNYIYVAWEVAKPKAGNGWSEGVGDSGFECDDSPQGKGWRIP